VKALILAAGYATRLRPLTDTYAKELLPVAARPIADWILDKVAQVDGVDDVHLVTNARKAPQFERWAAGRGVAIHDDGTTSNETRLGAIGDLRLVVEQTGLDDDLLVIAGDNLFEFSLARFVAFWRERGAASAVAVRDVGSLELARRYGIVAVDEDDRLVGFVEKPADPPSTLAATATYIFHRDHVRLVGRYLDEGNPPDQPGNFVAWLQQREPVYAFRFEEGWFDIGDRQQLLAADNRYRMRLGLPERDAYSVESDAAQSA
jgi:glucose-1-phosphate thymidylyltransferase